MLAGAVASLAFPPLDLGPLAFVALVPLAIAFSRAGATPTLWTSAGFATAFMALLIPWMRLFGNLAYLALVAQQVFMIVGGLTVARGLFAGWTERYRLLLFPFAFLGVEYLRSHVPYGGFPWGGIGYTQHDFPYLLKVASLAGVWGVCLLVVAVNAAIAEIVMSLRPPNPRGLVAVALGTGLVAAPLLIPVTEPDGESLRIAMVQGNTSESVADPHIDDEQVLLNHAQLTQSLRRGSADLVVWPESSLGRDPYGFPEFLDLVTQVVKEQGAPFLIGATVEMPESEEFLNTTLFIGSDGKLIDRYEKVRLVPFGEYVLFREWLEPWVDELRRVPFDGVPGTEHTVFEIPQGKIGSVICFESTFPGFVSRFIEKGAQILVVSTNDSSFERSSASEQHLAFSQLRAAEHRIWVTHVALTGISGVIAPDGTVQERTKLFEPALLQPEVKMATSMTLYGKLGDWLPFVSLGLIPVLGLAGWTSSRKGRKKQSA
ncbi:MAG: apolipoprotein N-acyltransferase [Acidimicrobiia bacterium]